MLIFTLVQSFEPHDDGAISADLEDFRDEWTRVSDSCPSSCPRFSNMPLSEQVSVFEVMTLPESGSEVQKFSCPSLLGLELMSVSVHLWEKRFRSSIFYSRYLRV